MAALESPPDPPQLSDVKARRLVIGPWDPPRLSDVTPLGTDNQAGLPDVGPRVVIGRSSGVIGHARYGTCTFRYRAYAYRTVRVVDR